MGGDQGKGLSELWYTEHALNACTIRCDWEVASGRGV